MAFFGLTALGAQNPFDVQSKTYALLCIFEVEEFQEAFEKIDKAGTGHIAITDLAELLKIVYHGPAPDPEYQLFLEKLGGKDRETTIMWEEFGRAYHNLCQWIADKEAASNDGIGAAANYVSYDDMEQSKKKHIRLNYGPKDKLISPLTAVQEIGWNAGEFIEKRTVHGKKSCAETIYANLGVTSFIMPSVGTVAGHCGAAAIFAVVGRAMLSTKGFEDELGFYGAYHQHPLNQLIHFFFIPCIWWTICVMMCYLPFPPTAMIGMNTIAGHRITWGTAMWLVYAPYYVFLDNFTGSIFAGVLFLFYLQASTAVASELAFNEKAATKKKSKPKKMTWFKFAFILHAVSWYMQIHPGHAMFEGVKPALLDSLGQAFGVAPFFGFLEGLWFAGFAPELKERVAVLVAENRAAMCAAGKDMPWC